MFWTNGGTPAVMNEIRTRLEHMHVRRGGVYRIPLKFSHLVSVGIPGSFAVDALQGSIGKTANGRGKITVTLTRANFAPLKCLPEIVHRADGPLE